MKHLVIAIAILFFGLFAYAENDTGSTGPGEATLNAKTDAAPQIDPRAHDGVWKPIAAVLGGVRLPPPVLNTITLKVTGENYEVTVEGEKEPDKGTCTLDPSTDPKRMTIKSTEGPNRGKTLFAIYEMKNNDAMRVCYDLSGTDFPKEFKAPKRTQIYLVGYRRQKQ